MPGWDTNGVPQESMRGKTSALKGGRIQWGFGKSIIKEDVERFFPREGENCIRIVQPLEVAMLKYYGMEISFHRNVGPNNDQFLCNKRMRRLYCHIDAQQSDDLWKSNPDLAKSYYPSDAVLMWVLDLKEEDPAKRNIIKAWCAPVGLAEEILGQSHKRESDVYIDVSHPVNGRNVYFTKKKTGKAAYQVEYVTVQIAETGVPLDESVANQRQPFEQILIWPDPKDVEEAFEAGRSAGTAAEGAGSQHGNAANSGQTGTDTAVFEPYWLETYCSACGAQQFMTKDGATCENEHMGVAGVTQEEWAKSQQPVEAAPPPPPPPPPVAAAPALDESAAPPCYKKDFDKYADCEGSCAFIEPCKVACTKSAAPAKAPAPAAPAPVEKPAPDPITDAPAASPAPATPPPSPPPAPAGGSVKDKLKAAIDRRNAQG